MAAKLQKTRDIGVAYIGDGAVEEGVVHESFNLAKIQNAPILFVIENNLFASHMHISSRQPSDMISRFAEANDIPFELVDGNDVVAVNQAAKRLVGDIRSGKGPRLLELVTYRFYGHVDWRDDIDVGIERSLDDLENWKARDPIVRLSKAMIESGYLSKDQESALNQRLDKKINEAWNRAISDPYPSPDATLKYVYSEGK
jgi:pyruvate dehydrogenase E1 component alpha subunit